MGAAARTREGVAVLLELDAAGAHPDGHQSKALRTQSSSEELLFQLHLLAFVHLVGEGLLHDGVQDDGGGREGAGPGQRGGRLDDPLAPRGGRQPGDPAAPPSGRRRGDHLALMPGTAPRAPGREQE